MASMKRTLTWAAMAIALAAGPVLADAGHSHGKADVSLGGPGKPADAKRVVRIEARDRDYNVRQIQARPGETIRFIITNKSSIRHEFGIARHQEHVEHRAMMAKLPDMVHDDDNVVTVEPGETKEIVWRFGTHQDAFKDLEFSCNIPGHAEQGMQGVFRRM
jgi:uncharacterized cupredoxin-like copper-binding protein